MTGVRGGLDEVRMRRPGSGVMVETGMPAAGSAGVATARESAMDPALDPAELAAAAAPDGLGRYLAGLPMPPMHHQHGPAKTVRTTEYEGHRIVVTTTYEVTVDEEPVKADLQVDDNGTLYCHGLPNYQFVSALDTVRALIANYPGRFRGGA